jgi:mannose-6-phosphate isomerase-like protein (cupin superfamily)
MKNTYEMGQGEDRPWGRWDVTAVGEGFIKKIISVNAGEILSLQRHQHRDEDWTIVSGSGVITINEIAYPCKTGQHFRILKTAWHRIENTGKEPLVFEEIQTGTELREDDIERKQDKYNRS